MVLKAFTSGQEFIRATSDFIVALTNVKEGSVYIALSGGKTPAPVYQALSKNPELDFTRVEWFAVDERCVPLSHQHSNLKMIKESFSAAEPTFSQHLHWFNTDLSPNEAAREYEEELKTIPGFDLVILGIGNDGHTASLFPRSSSLKEQKRRAIHTVNESVPNPPVVDRLTITWPMILSSRNILLLASGKEKRHILDDLVNSAKTSEELPAKELLIHPSLTIFYRQ